MPGANAEEAFLRASSIKPGFQVNCNNLHLGEGRGRGPADEGKQKEHVSKLELQLPFRAGTVKAPLALLLPDQQQCIQFTPHNS